MPDRAKRDKEPGRSIKRVRDRNDKVCGVHKVWRRMRREDFAIARRTVARPMKEPGLEGVLRGKKVRAAIPDKFRACPPDRVKRQFKVPAPDRLRVSDLTHAAAWRGFVHVAFVIDAFAHRIAGWRVSRTAHAGFVPDALEQAVHRRQPGAGPVHHPDRGSQYPSIRYTERLAEAGIEPCAGSVGDSHDNALAETIDGLFKAARLSTAVALCPFAI